MNSVGTPQYQQNTIQSLTIYIHSFHFKFPNDEFEEKRWHVKWNLLVCADKHFWIMFFFLAWSNLHGKNCVWGSCDWTTSSHAKVNLAKKIHHSDFIYILQRLRRKRMARIRVLRRCIVIKSDCCFHGYRDLSLFGGTTIVFYIPNSRDWNNTVLRVIAINSF